MTWATPPARAATSSRHPDTVRAPDAAFISSERIPPGGVPDEEYIEGAPDLAVEVVSPDDTESQVAEKVAMYLAAGARRVWRCGSG
jgi:Uma2 family endonuclease